MTASSSPTLAFVLPARNYPAETMRRCIDSIRSQADADVADIVVADFGSSPEHAAAARAVAREGNARHVWFDEQGPWNRSRAINRGVRATTAPVIITADADLVFATNFTRVILDVAREAGGAFYAHAPMMDLPPNITIECDDYAADYECLLTVAEERVWGKGNVVFSRGLFDEMRGWEEAYTIWGCEDNDFFDRATRSGARVFDLKGSTSCLHHWHPSNKRGRQANAQVARNQLMFWPLEREIPVRRTGTFADDPALPDHLPFQTPTVSIVITDAADKARTEATLASLDAQTFRDFDIHLAAGTPGVGGRPDVQGDIIGFIPAGALFPDEDALAWRVLIPLLKRQKPARGFMWRQPSVYTPTRQIVRLHHGQPTSTA